MRYLLSWFPTALICIAICACGVDAEDGETSFEPEDCGGNSNGNVMLGDQGMVYVAEGSFMMGCNPSAGSSCSPVDSPFHEVYLGDFCIDVTEVTAGAFKACVDAGACTYVGDAGSPRRTYNNSRDNHPINLVTWEEAKTYCEWLGKRLPTEAEWEKAARGTDGRNYPWGYVPSVSCTHVVMENSSGEGCGTGATWEVGSKPLGVSPYGALDMLGNVWEWTADWFDEGYYSEEPAGGWVNPEGPSSGSQHVIRGGAFVNSETNKLGVSHRFSYRRNFDIGFRCAQ